jgi:hypothetical protein
MASLSAPNGGGCSTSLKFVFRSVARALLDRRFSRVQTSCRNRGGIQAKSAVSLKGIVMDALREGGYSIVMDQVNRPSQSFAAAVREIISWCSTPVIAVARSSREYRGGQSLRQGPGVLSHARSRAPRLASPGSGRIARMRPANSRKTICLQSSRERNVGSRGPLLDGL